MVVYVLAMFAHAAEWAAARRLGVTVPAAQELVDVAAAEMRALSLPRRALRMSRDQISLAPVLSRTGERSGRQSSSRAIRQDRCGADHHRLPAELLAS